MKKFKYRALKQDGTKVEAEYEGESREAVMAMITSNGYYPLMIDEVVESQKIEFSFMKKVGVKDLSVFCRQFYTMLDAGVAINNCLSILTTQVTNKYLRTATKDLEEGVKKGEMLSEAMNRHKDIFPSLLRSMVASGETSGNLDEMMLRMSVNFEKDNKINGKVKGAMIYPIILAIICLVAVNFILIFILPTFAGVYEDSGADLPWITQALLNLSHFMINNFIIIALVLVAAIVGIAYYKKTESGIEFFSRLKLKVPIYKTLTQKVIVSRFTRTLSTLLSAGVSLIQALPIVASVMDNRVAEQSMALIRERVARGDGLSEPIRADALFPPMLSSMIRIGEEAGNLDEILNKTADFYDEEVQQAVDAATSMLEPLMIVVMGVAIGTIVIAIMLPMFGMYDYV